MRVSASPLIGILLSSVANILILKSSLLMVLSVQLQGHQGKLHAQVITDGVVPEDITVCDRRTPKVLADIERHDAIRTKFLECFPVVARKLLETSTGEPYSDAEIRIKANALSKAFDDPVDMLVATCKALGEVSNDDWNYLDESCLVLFEAIKGVDIEHYFSAVALIKNDEKAMFGAARILFDPSVYFIELLGSTGWNEYVPNLANIALELGSDHNQNLVISAISDRGLPAATKLLREIANNKRVCEATPHRSKVSPHIFALMKLASRNDQSIKGRVDKLLSNTKRELDVAALEVSMALLGEPKHLSKSHYEIRSRQIELAALKAIEKYSSQYGMDILIYSALTRRSVQQEASITLQRLSGQRWLPSEDVQQRLEYAQDAAAWWKANPDVFAQPYVADVD